MKKIFIFLVILSFSPTLVGMEQDPQTSATELQEAAAPNNQVASVSHSNGQAVGETAIDMQAIMARLDKLEQGQDRLQQTQDYMAKSQKNWLTKSFHTAQVVGSVSSTIGLVLYVASVIYHKGL